MSLNPSYGEKEAIKVVKTTFHFLLTGGITHKSPLHRSFLQDIKQALKIVIQPQGMFSTST